MAELKKSLGLGFLTFYGTGMILGAGIYSVIGKAAGETGYSLWIGFIFAAIMALITGLSYAELSTMYPKAGGEFVYLSHAFEKQGWLAKTIGMAMVFSGIATACTVALAFSGYLNEFIEMPTMLIAGAVLFLATFVNLVGVKESGWTNILFTLIEIGGLLLFIGLAWTTDKFGTNLSMQIHWGTLSGTALIVFSYFGFENIVNLAEEAKDPEKDLPRAILISIGVSTLLYILVSVAALALLTPQALAESDAVLAVAARTKSEKIAQILGAIALFSTANTALIAMIGSSRVLYGMGKAKAIPKYLSKVSKSRQSPWVAILFCGGASWLLLPLGRIESVAAVSSLATIISFFAVNIALISLRFSNPNKKRPFKTPFSFRRVPILPVFGALLSVLFISQFSKETYVICAAVLGSLALYFVLTPSSAN